MVKKSFISQIIESIRNFDSYKKISNDNLSKSFKYLLLLMLIYAIIMTIGTTYQVCSSIEQAQNFIQTELTDLYYDNGKLSVNNNEYSSFYDNYIIIDTSEEANIKNYDGNFVFGKSGFRIKAEGNYLEFNYSNFINKKIEKNDIVGALDAKKYVVIIIVVSLIASYIATCVATLLDILVIALIGLIISSITGNNKIKFKNAFNISTHAITLPVALGMIYFLINTFTGFYIRYFSTMYTIIANIYMITAILLINADKAGSGN